MEGQALAVGPLLSSLSQSLCPPESVLPSGLGAENSSGEPRHRKRFLVDFRGPNIFMMSYFVALFWNFSASEMTEF